jgi:hypothetical protein
MVGIEILGSMTPDNLIGGQEIELLTTKVTIASGQKLKRGTVLGIVTASGKAKTVLNTANDGSQTAKLVLCDDVDASMADKEAFAYKTGMFNRSALIVGINDTIANHEAELRAVHIHLKAVLLY